jgi:hypothetical protein
MTRLGAIFLGLECRVNHRVGDIALRAVRQAGRGTGG